MSSASQMVDRLVGQGLVHREQDAGNRRQVVIHLTPQGEELIGELRRGILRRYEKILDRLSDRDQEALVESFETIARIMEEVRPDSPGRNAMTRIAVIGAGISGLSTAFAMQQGAEAAGLEVEICVLEKKDRTGGKIQSIRRGGLSVRVGPQRVSRQQADDPGALRPPRHSRPPAALRR